MKNALKQKRLKHKQNKSEVNTGHEAGWSSAKHTDIGMTSMSGGLLSETESEDENDDDSQLDGDVQYGLSKNKRKLLKREGATSGLTITLSFGTLLFMGMLVIAAVAAVVAYRMAVTEALTLMIAFSYASTLATITGKLLIIATRLS